MTTPQLAIPYLESGDRLTRAEFERRYNATPDGFKAELIEGVVSVASPVRFATHSEPHSRIIMLPGVYAAATTGVRVGDIATVRLDWENELQPDGLLRLENGTSTIDADGCVASVNRRSSSPKLLEVALRRTCTSNCASTGVTACKNIWCGWSSKSGSSGSRSTKASTGRYLPTPTISPAVASFPVSGSTCPRFCAAIWQPHLRHCSRGSPLPTTPRLSSACDPVRERHTYDHSYA